MRRFFIALLAITYIYGCKSNRTEILTFDNSSNIEVSNSIKDSSFCITLNEVRYVALETCDSSIIGQITKILVYNDKIYVLDMRYANAVFMFDINGKFIKKIGKKGNGPDEYNYITDFDISSEGILCLNDQRTKKILFYDENGSFTNSKRYKTFASRLGFINEENVFFFRGPLACFDKSDKNTGIFFSVKDQLELNTVLRNKGRIIETYFGSSLYRSNKELYLIDPYDCIVYSFRGNNLKPKFKINIVNNEKLSIEEVDKLDYKSARNNILQQGLLGVEIDNYYENDSLIIFAMTNWMTGKSWPCFYSKSSSKVISIKNIGMYKNSRIGLLGGLIPKGVYNNSFITIIQGQALNSYSKQAKKGINHFLDISKGTNGMEVFENLDINSNPVLAFYQLYSF